MVIFIRHARHNCLHTLAPCHYLFCPTRVLWPLVPSNLPDGITLDQLPLGPNVKVVPWVDYNDVLGEASMLYTHNLKGSCTGRAMEMVETTQQ